MNPGRKRQGSDSLGNVDPMTNMERRLARGEIAALAARMRALSLISIHAAGSGHPGGSLSVMDLAAVLLLDEARHVAADADWDGRDRVFFSAGHKAPALYAALVLAGRCREEDMVTLRKLGSPFQGHPHRHNLPGIEVSSGSLGQGLGHRGRLHHRWKDREEGLQGLLRDGRRRTAGGVSLGGRHGRSPTTDSRNSAPSSTATDSR